MATRSDGQPARTQSDETDAITILNLQTGMLRTISEQLNALTKLLTPQAKDGPTLDDLIAELVNVLKELNATVIQTDRRITALATDLPPVVAADVLRGIRNRNLSS